MILVVARNHGPTRRWAIATCKLLNGLVTGAHRVLTLVRVHRRL
jgi:hypothetical protein